MKTISFIIFLLFSASSFSQVNMDYSGSVTVGGFNAGGVDMGSGVTYGGITVGGVQVNHQYESSSSAGASHEGYGTSMSSSDYVSPGTACDLEINIKKIKRGNLKDQSINLLLVSRDENPEIKIQLNLINSLGSTAAKIASRVFPLDADEDEFIIDENLVQLDKANYKTAGECIINKEIEVKVLDYNYLLPSKTLAKETLNLSEIENELAKSETGIIEKSIKNQNTGVEVVLELKR